MHEMAITEQMLATALRHAEQAGRLLEIVGATE